MIEFLDAEYHRNMPKLVVIGGYGGPQKAVCFIAVVVKHVGDSIVSSERRNKNGVFYERRASRTVGVPPSGRAYAAYIELGNLHLSVLHEVGAYRRKTSGKKKKRQAGSPNHQEEGVTICPIPNKLTLIRIRTEPTSRCEC